MSEKRKKPKNYIKWIRKKVGHEKIILVHAGGCIFNDKGEVLLQRRGDCNMWGFPGGALELGETPEMAAVREVKEETGLDVKVGRLIGVYTDTDAICSNGDKYQSVCVAYELSVNGGELSCDNNETLELKYFPINNTPQTVLQAARRDIGRYTINLTVLMKFRAVKFILKYFIKMI